MRRFPVKLVGSVCANPALLMSFSRGAYRSILKSRLDYGNVDGSTSALWLLSLRITHRCNHRCAICAQWGQAGYNARDDTPKVTGEVPLEVYKRVIDDVAPKKVHVYITGGEPFLYQPLVELVNYIKEKGLTVQIVTNGVGLERNAETIVENGWDMICVSFDGPREIHDKCRGVPGAFDAAIKGLSTIQKLKKEKNKRKPAIFTLTTISSNNQYALLDTVKEAEVLRPGGVVVYYSWFTKEWIGEKHTQIASEKLGITPFAWKGYVRDTASLDIDAITKQVKKIKNEKIYSNTLFVPDLKLEDIRTYYTQPENFFGYKKCVAPWFQLDVMPNGDVVTCRDFPDFVTGNIMERPILEIYNSEKYRKFRRALRSCDNGVFPICSRCCGLMGY
ncbi:MAG TPA: radical SAM protein [Candidatus Limnocylindrales bacterium]|nr:radical SAM protein [Candidatus Limnocylindrales bacterium]